MSAKGSFAAQSPRHDDLLASISDWNLWDVENGSRLYIEVEARILKLLVCFCRMYIQIAVFEAFAPNKHMVLVRRANVLLPRTQRL